MRHMPIDRNPMGEFSLGGRRIADGDRLELMWPDGQTVTAIVKVIGGELRIVGVVHGAKCWITLAPRRHDVMARWPDGYG